MHDVTWLVLRTTGIKMHGENFKEGSIPIYWIDANTALQILGDEFL